MKKDSFSDTKYILISITIVIINIGIRFIFYGIYNFYKFELEI